MNEKFILFSRTTIINENILFCSLSMFGIIEHLSTWIQECSVYKWELS